MPKNPLFIAAAIAFISFVAAPGQAHAAPECGPFAVMLENEHRHFVNIAAEGASPGDMRVLRMKLKDEDGNKIGTLHISSVLLPPVMEDGAQNVQATQQHVFENGTIASIAIILQPDMDDIDVEPVASYAAPVLGGTGEFIHVSGAIERSMDKDGNIWFRYDLRCPE